MNGELIPLRTYMHQWLYESRHNSGYYLAGRGRNVGKDGDFYTSVSTSKFFGGAIARYIIRLLEEERLTLPLSIVEIGANNADLIADIAEFLSACSQEVFDGVHFYIIEPLESLRSIQSERFCSRITQRLGKNVCIVDTLDSLTQNMRAIGLEQAFFISNEIFDSMPCDLVLDSKMLSLTHDRHVWHSLDSEVQAFCQKYEKHCGEIPISWESFVADILHANIAKWVFLSFDYGDFGARDMNLRMYSRHQVFNFYEELQANRLESFYQKADITYDVDFSLLQRMFHAGADCLFCQTQVKALIEQCFIVELFELFTQHFDSQTYIREKTKMQGLITPNALGERFKAVCFQGGNALK